MSKTTQNTSSHFANPIAWRSVLATTCLHSSFFSLHKKKITHSKCVCVLPGRMSQCAISSTNVISKGVSQLIKMGTGSSLRAHQITERPFIATLFVITPNWLPWSSLCLATELCTPWEKGRRRKRRKKNSYYYPGRVAQDRNRQEKDKTFSRCLQSASHCHILRPSWRSIWRAAGLLCFWAQITQRDWNVNRGLWYSMRYVGCGRYTE